MANCLPVDPHAHYGDGLQWVVDKGLAIQRGSIHNDEIPVYKLGAGTLRLQGDFVGSGFNAPLEVREGSLQLAAHSQLSLERSADAAHEPVLQMEPQADIKLDGVLLIGLQGEG